ncbi:MAG: hypothetical protein N2578_08800 [Bdellovibrionaceae bacterium]|nr:hypothetical protein [Pseudobdellovibrionaceae bacterium]
MYGRPFQFLTVLPFLFSLVAVSIRPAHALPDSPQPEAEFELTETTLPQAKTKQTQEKLKIVLSDSVQFEIEARPDVERMKETLGLKFTPEMEAKIRESGGVIPDVNPMEGYESLDAQAKERFAKTRVQFLTALARALNASKMMIGGGLLMKDAFTFVKVKTLKVLGKPVELNHPEMSRPERVQRAIGNFLQSVDYKLWNQAPLVISANEFGFAAHVGLVTGGGVRSSGYLFHHETSISITYNKETRGLVFEIGYVKENFQHTLMGIGVAGVIGKGGVRIARRTGGLVASNLSGTSFYPPMIPAFSTFGPELFQTGTSTTFGFPPSPFADILTWTNKMSHHTAIRISISPFMKGFVRLQFGDAIPALTVNLLGEVKLLVYRTADVVLHFTRNFIARSCARAFAN